MTSRELYERVKDIAKIGDRIDKGTRVECDWARNLLLAEIAFQLALMNEERRLNTKEGNKG